MVVTTRDTSTESLEKRRRSDYPGTSDLHFIQEAINVLPSLRRLDTEPDSHIDALHVTLRPQSEPPIGKAPESGTIYVGGSGTGFFVTSNASMEAAYNVPQTSWFRLKEIIDEFNASISESLIDTAYHVRSAGLVVGRGHIQDPPPNRGLAMLKDANPISAQNIQELMRLEQGWDGYGGDPLTTEAVEVTAWLLLTIERLTQGALGNPFIAPLPDGGLELEWELTSGNELMLVIPPEGKDLEFVLNDKDSTGGIVESEGVIPKDATLSDLVYRLTQ